MALGIRPRRRSWRRRKSIFIPLVVSAAALALVGACQGGYGDGPALKRFAKAQIEQNEPKAGRVKVLNASVSADGKVICGVSRIGPYRTSPYALVMDRARPSNKTVKVEVQPSIDHAANPDWARAETLRQEAAIPALCQRAGVPITAPT
ncbi:hypothetical protein [Caulobacter sp. NIBR2454]|uniref:hypothetical protein n=1 Tax=Caulobacter sp. NIBR2454 TaxID=3015996 RepID=UPI0022B64B1F|nr:hypothetical protein [Caulobacter sp. NIBR2454]